MITAQRQATGEFEGGDETIVSSLPVPGIEPSNWRLVLTAEPARATVAAR